MNVRRENHYTQSDIAKLLHMTKRQYQRLESGDTVGKVEDWDTLEDLFGINQRDLRENALATKNVIQPSVSLTQSV
jgi:transcriptional regulator with XRE-family HTH domain